MSASNETTNYKLPLFADTDQPTWLGDFNGAMNKLDADLNTIGANASTALSASNNAVSRVATIENTVSAVQSTANSALSLAQTNEQDIANCAEKNHAASTPSTYGGGTDTLYGHVKLSDNVDPAITSASSIALSPAACATHVWRFCEDTTEENVVLNKEWSIATLNKRLLGDDHAEFFTLAGSTITCVKPGYYEIITSCAGGAASNTNGRIGVGIFKGSVETSSAFSYAGDYANGVISSATATLVTNLSAGDTLTMKCFGNFGTDTWVKHLASTTTNTIVRYLGK